MRRYEISAWGEGDYGMEIDEYPDGEWVRYDDLAAEVRELRRDKARLDWLLVNDARLIWSMRDQKHYAVKADGDVIGVGAYGKKAAIDAAMSQENTDAE